MGGSHFNLPVPIAASGGQVPKLDPHVAKKTFAAMHRAIHAGLVRACHDLSEGGLAVAAAEMAFAGGFGADVDLDRVPCWSDGGSEPAALLFSESNSAVPLRSPPRTCAMRSKRRFEGQRPSELVAFSAIGTVTDGHRLA